jgi:hypothetical protein
VFVRFVVPVRDEDSHRLTGVFQAACRLRDGDLPDADARRLGLLLRWFDRHLPAPARLSRSRRRHAHAEAVCWLRQGATGRLEKLRELAALLDRHGIATRRLRTRRPGYIVYEDEYQVAAVPFRDTGA